MGKIEIKKLTKEQQKYCMQRVSEIRAMRIKQIDAESKQTGKLTDAEKIGQIKSGTAWLKEDAKLSQKLVDCYRFNTASERHANHEKRDLLISQLHKDCAKISDEIMLGDGANALKLLTALEATVK